MTKHKVSKAIPKEDVPDEVEQITRTWALKKTTGSRRERMDTHGFKQRAGVDFKKDSILSPVTNEVKSRVVLVIMIVLQLLS